MRRREFMAGLGSAAAAWPAHAQQHQPVIGLLGIGAARNAELVVAPVRRGLREAGFIEGRDFVMEQRWAEGQYQRIPDFAEEFVRRQVSVIIAAGGTQSALVARAGLAQAKALGFEGPCYDGYFGAGARPARPSRG